MIMQIRNYLNQLVRQLNFAMANVSQGSSGDGSSVVIRQASAPQTSAKADAESTFGSIKSLIIKSADIVNAYYDEIMAKLEGRYFAESDFGTFIEETTNSIEAKSQSITQYYTELQTIVSDINTKVSEVDTRAYIKTGKLEELTDGTVIYGVEVGQRTEMDGEETMDKYARFTPGKLEFFDKTVPVAWISGYKLFITNAEVQNELKIGGFVIGTGNGLTLQWEGVSE
jgi:hypothetical protein